MEYFTVIYSNYRLCSNIENARGIMLGKESRLQGQECGWRPQLCAVPTGEHSHTKQQAPLWMVNLWRHLSNWQSCFIVRYIIFIGVLFLRCSTCRFCHSSSMAPPSILRDKALSYLKVQISSKSLKKYQLDSIYCCFLKKINGSITSLCSAFLGRSWQAFRN